MLKNILFFTLSVLLFSCTRNPDDIKPVIAEQLLVEDEISRQNNAFNVFLEEKNYVAAEKIATRQIEAGRTENDLRKVAWGNFNLGMLFGKQRKLGESLEKFLIALDLFEKIGGKNEIAVTTHKVGAIYRDLLAYQKSLVYLQKAVDQVSYIKDNVEISKLYRNLGLVFQNLQDFEKAGTYYEKSLAIRLQINDPASLLIIYRDLGELHRNLKNYDKALDFFNKLLEESKKINSSTAIASAYNNIGNTYRYEENYSKALDYLEKSSMLQAQIEDPNLVIILYQNFGHVYLLQKNYDKALSYLIKAEALAQEADAKEDLLETYELLEKLYVALNNMDKAYEYSKLASALKATLMTIENSLFAQNLSVLNLAEQKASTFNSPKTPHSQQMPYLLGIIMMFALTFLLIGYFFTKNIHLKKSLLVVVKEKDTLANIYHREKKTYDQVLNQFKILEKSNKNFEQLDNAYSELYKDYKESLKKEEVLQEEKNTLLKALEKAKNEFVRLEIALQARECALDLELENSKKLYRSFIDFKELYEQVLFLLQIKNDHTMLETIDQMKEIYLRGKDNYRL